MKGLGLGNVEARGVVSTGRTRELTAEEVDEVAGALPVVIVAVVVVAITAQKLSEGSSESSEQEEDGDDD